jgi:molecular chaperone GrpE
MTTTNNDSESKTDQLNSQDELPKAEASGEVTSSSSQQGEVLPAPPDNSEQPKKERDLLLDRIARLQAEFENARKRSNREQKEFRELALAGALGSLLPVLDSFDRALETPTTSIEELRSGVELIRRQFEDVLKKLGVSRIPAKGSQFDPQLHHAVERVSTTSLRDNQVLEELQSGYKLHDRLLRPAMVRVAHDPEHDAEQKAA